MMNDSMYNTHNHFALLIPTTPKKASVSLRKRKTVHKFQLFMYHVLMLHIVATCHPSSLYCLFPLSLHNVQTFNLRRSFIVFTSALRLSVCVKSLLDMFGAKKEEKALLMFNFEIII